jgi:hypothetical protein
VESRFRASKRPLKPGRRVVYRSRRGIRDLSWLDFDR